jgi:hypothetical protein
MNKKYTWSSNDGPQSALADRLAKEDLQILKQIEMSDTKDLSVAGLKRSLFDVKSYELWSQDVPEIKKLQIGDTFEVPHYVYRPYSDRRRGYRVCNAEFKVLDKKTHKRVDEVLDADGTKFNKRKYEKTYVLLESAIERNQGPDTWFERCSNFSARRENGGYYYPLKKKKQQWVSQQEILMMFLKDGGLCPLIRRKQSCRYCEA